MKRIKQDPRWIEARFSSTCPKCGRGIREGDRIFYYPSDKKAYCDGDDCGSQMSRDFSAACFDEAQYNGGF